MYSRRIGLNGAIKIFSRRVGPSQVFFIWDDLVQLKGDDNKLNYFSEGFKQEMQNLANKSLNKKLRD